jgi:hypothetical protein
MPFLRGSILFANLTDFVAKFFFEICICNQKIVDELFDDGLDVRAISNLVN